MTFNGFDSSALAGTAKVLKRIKKIANRESNFLISFTSFLQSSNC